MLQWGASGHERPLQGPLGKRLADAGATLDDGSLMQATRRESGEPSLAYGKKEIAHVQRAQRQGGVRSEALTDNDKG
jgi:hypothetical protein